MSETRLLLVRHAQATSGPDHRWTIDDPLTTLGDVQARDLAEHLAAMRRPATRIVTSSALRARQTAAVCAERMGIDVVEDARLVEFGSGTVSPFTLREMLEHLPYDDIWHPDDPGWDGEPIGAFWRRTADVSEQLVREGGRPLVVAHGGTITGILRWALGIDHQAPDAVHFFVANASLTDLRLRIDRHGRRRVMLARLNETGYLGEVTEV